MQITGFFYGTVILISKPAVTKHLLCNTYISISHAILICGKGHDFVSYVTCTISPSQLSLSNTAAKECFLL